MLKSRTNPLIGFSAALLLLLALGAGGTACQKEGKDGSGPAPMDFRVDASLLGPAVTDSVLRITFRPPSIFVPVAPERLAAIQAQVRNSLQADDPMATMPVLIYGKPGTTGLCTLSRFVTPPQDGIAGAWADRARRLTRQRVAPARVEDDLYSVHGITALQFLVQNESMVLFRLICQGPGPGPVQIDYLLPRGEYQAAVRGIESSIGSLSMF